MSPNRREPPKSRSQKKHLSRKVLSAWGPQRQSKLAQTVVPTPTATTAPVETTVEFKHRDYRIIFNDTMEAANRGQPGSREGWWIKHRDVFEDLSHREHPIAALMRALGLYETRHYETYKELLAHDQVLGPCWLTMFFEVRRLLNGELNGMDGGLCDSMLMALARNAGFSDKEIA